MLCLCHSQGCDRQHGSDGTPPHGQERAEAAALAPPVGLGRGSAPPPGVPEPVPQVSGHARPPHAAVVLARLRFDRAAAQLDAVSVAAGGGRVSARVHRVRGARRADADRLGRPRLEEVLCLRLEDGRGGRGDEVARDVLVLSPRRRRHVLVVDGGR